MSMNAHKIEMKIFSFVVISSVNFLLHGIYLLLFTRVLLIRAHYMVLALLHGGDMRSLAIPVVEIWTISG